MLSYFNIYLIFLFKMVKNTTGGKFAKSSARKNLNNNSFTRLKSDEQPLELYAIVIKALGMSLFSVKTHNGLSLTLHLRGKFTGKNKRNNFLSVGAFVLVGLWEFSSSQLNCDLIEIYNSHDHHFLLNSKFHYFFREHLNHDLYNNANNNNTNNIKADSLTHPLTHSLT